MSSKFQEIEPISLEDCLMVSKSFSANSLIELEHEIISTLSFKVCVPTVYEFLNLIFKRLKKHLEKIPHSYSFNHFIDELEKFTVQVGKVLSVDIKLLAYKPSLRAAVIFHTALSLKYNEATS